MTENQYGKLVAGMQPKSKTFRNCIWAFCVGGMICALGQVFAELYGIWLPKEDACLCASLTLVVLSAMFTGLSLYDDLAKHAGAGTLVPITGFANAVAAPAAEFKTEGYILGMAAKMFVIAGPVLVYGTAAGVLCGILYFFLK